jgi:hypothetical protein
MLLFNGHESHVTLEAVQYCEDNKIVLFCLPSHSTHILQPLDIGVFGPPAISYWKFMFEETRTVLATQLTRSYFFRFCKKQEKKP